MLKRNLKHLFVLSVLSLLPALAAQETEKKLVTYWNFDEKDGEICRDVSGNRHDLKIANNMRGVKRVEGRKGMALHFIAEKKGERNQAGAASMINNFNVDFTKGFTFECWVKMDADAEWPRRTYNIYTNAPGNYGHGFIVFFNWRYYTLLNGPGGKDGHKTKWEAAALTPDLRGQWVHLAATYDGKRGRMYVNGECKAETKTDVQAYGRKNSWPTIGSGWNGLQNGFPGIIDEVRIYNYALTPTEIVQHAKLDD